MAGLELATAYVSLVVDTKGMSREIDRTLKASGASADRAGSDMGNRMSSALGKTLKAGVIGAAATATTAAVAGIGTALTKGWQRLSAIDDAQGKLTALGHTSQSTAKIMDSALASVKGTSYGLGEAAAISASAVAAGIEPGKELTKYLSLIADTATVAGAPLEEIGMLFNQATTKGKVYTLQLNQLAQRGIPIYQYLAKELGVSQEALSEMVREGEVDAETYRKAIENNIGGAATAATTVSSQWANTMAAMGRLGAAALEPTFGRLTGWLGSGIEGIDNLTDVVKPLAQALDAKVFEEWGPKLAEGFDALRDNDFVAASVERVKTVFEDLLSTAESLWPSVQTIRDSLNEAVAATGISTWQILLATLEGIAPILDATLVPALQATASLMENNQGAVTALVLAFAAFKAIPALVSRISPPFVAVGNSVTNTTGAIRGFGQHMQLQTRFAEQAGQRITRMGAAMAVLQTRSTAIGRMGEAYRSASSHLNGLSRNQAAAARTAQALANRAGDAFTRVDALGRAAGLNAASNLSRMGAVASGTGAAGLSAISTAAGNASRAVGGLVSAMGGPLVVGLMATVGAVVAVSSESKKWDRQAQSTAKMTEDVAEAQRRMGDAFADSAGKVDDSVFSQVNRQVELYFDTLKSNAASSEGMFAGLTENWKDLQGLFSGDEDRGSRELQQFRDRKDAAEQTLAALENLGIGSTEVARAVAGGQGSWDSFIGSLRATGEVSDETIDFLQGLRREFNDQREAAKRLSPGIMELNEHFMTLADSASSAEDKSSALKRTLDLLAGGTPDLNNAMQEYNELVRDTAESTAEAWDQTKGWGQELLGENGFDTTTTNGAKARDMILDIRDATADVVAAGGDLDATLVSNDEMFARIAESAGISVDELMRMAELEGYLPEVFAMTVRIQGAEDTESQLAAIATYIDQFPDKPLVLNTEGLESAIDKLREYGFEVEDIGNGQVRIDIDDEDGLAKLNDFLAELGVLDESEATPTVDLNDEMLVAKANEADDMIAYLHTQEAIPEADLIIDKLQEGKEISVQELVDLSSKVADPEVILEIAKAMSASAEVDKELDRIVQKQRIAEIQVKIASDAPIHSIDAWANAFGGQVQGRATGGPITGGVWGKDSVPILAMPGEHMLTVDDVNRLGGQEGVYRFRAALQAGQVGRYAQGGPIVQSMVQAVQRRFPGMEFTSGLRNTDNGYHSKNMAADFSDGFDSTPTMRALAAWIADNYAGITLQLIHQPFNRNIGQGQGFVGDGIGFYGSGTMAEHRDHVHWAVSEEVGEPSSDITGVGGIYSQPVEWTEKDELDLEDARVKVLQAQEARDKAYANEKKSDADRQAADIKVQRAELKVRELENKRDGKAGVEPIITPAPELEGEMDEDSLTIRRAEIAITDAQLARDKVYSDPESTTLDKEKADLAVYDARNNLESTIERIDEAKEKDSEKDNKNGWTTETLRDRVASYGAQVAGIMFDSALEIFGIESRWLDIPWPKYEAESAKDKKKSKSKDKKTDIIGSRKGDTNDGGGGHPDPLAALLDGGKSGPKDFAWAMPSTAVGNPKWIEDLLKKGPKVYDQGGWLKPNEMAINLGKKPEPVFTPAEFENIAQIANLESLEPAMAGAPDFSVHIHQPQFANESKMMRSARDAQVRQKMRYGGRF